MKKNNQNTSKIDQNTAYKGICFKCYKWFTIEESGLLNEVLCDECRKRLE